MIPSTLFKRFVLFVIFIVVAGFLMALADFLMPSDHKPFGQTLAALLFLFLFYATGPISANYLATQDETQLNKLTNALFLLRGDAPTCFIHDHNNIEANTVGISASYIYLTSSLIRELSEGAIACVISHEKTHIREHHLLYSLLYTLIYTIASHFVNSVFFTALGFLTFMLLRRYLEHRADMGAAAEVGTDQLETMLLEFMKHYPEGRLSRFFSFLTPYPTLTMRLDAARSKRFRFI